MKNWLILLLALLALLVTGCQSDSESSTETTHSSKALPYILSAHYFTDAWPKTFWQAFETGKVAGELAQIKQDGFNTVVLAVPWRGFETGFQNQRTSSRQVMYERLDFLLNAITEQDLLYVLRLGFPHDYSADTGTTSLALCEGLFTQQQTRDQWLDYLHKINQVTSKYSPANAGTLVSWEDFWCPHFVFPQLDAEQRLSLSQQMGYGQWLQQRNPNINRVLLGIDDLRYDQIPVPQPGELSYVLYLEFIDEALNQHILAPAKSVFNNTAMEIRVDKLPINNGQSTVWVSHDLHLDEPHHRGTYWAPFWGADNRGELLAADKALQVFEYFLKQITQDGQSNNHVIEQFNFYDNTPYFPNNANIDPDQTADFLLGAVPLLKKYSAGVGVWAYRDYDDNGLYNASFEIGLTGWQATGEVKVIDTGDDHQLAMSTGAQISQSFIGPERFMLVGQYPHLEFCLQSQESGTLQLLMNQQPVKTWEIETGRNCTQVPAEPFQQNTAAEFSLQAQSAITIDELKLYGFTQKLGLYQANGQPGRHLEAYREFNRQLAK